MPPKLLGPDAYRAITSEDYRAKELGPSAYRGTPSEDYRAIPSLLAPAELPCFIPKTLAPTELPCLEVLLLLNNGRS